MTSMITARVDQQKRIAAEKVFAEVGLTTSGAVNLFICAVAMRGGIPFPIEAKASMTGSHTTTESPRRRGGIKIGIADGKYALGPDFDKAFDDMDAEVAELFAQ